MNGFKSNKWFKIKDTIFHTISMSCQLSIGSHGSIDISLDIKKHPEYSKYFYKIFDNTFCSKTGKSYSKSEIAFEIITNEWSAVGCLIGTIDIDNSNGILNLTIISDYIFIQNINDRRDLIINQILDKTYDEDIDINKNL